MLACGCPNFLELDSELARAEGREDDLRHLADGPPEEDDSDCNGANRHKHATNRAGADGTREHAHEGIPVIAFLGEQRSKD